MSKQKGNALVPSSAPSPVPMTVKEPSTSGVVMDAADFMRVFQQAGKAARIDVTLKLAAGQGITAIYRGKAARIVMAESTPDKNGEIPSIQTWYCDLVIDDENAPNIRARLMGDLFINGFLDTMQVGTKFGLFNQGQVDTRSGKRVNTYMTGVFEAGTEGDRQVINID